MATTRIRHLIMTMVLVMAATLMLAHGASSDAAVTFQKIEFPGAQFTGVLGINDHMDIVGGYYDADRRQHAFLFRNGRYFKIDPPGSFDAVAVGIDNAGRIIGSASELQGADGAVSHAFVRKNEKHYRTVEPPGATRSWGLAINNRGDMLGMDGPGPNNNTTAPYSSGYLISNGKVSPVLFDAVALNAAMHYVGYPVSNSSDPFCGCYDSFVSNGKVTKILRFPGAHVTQANAINDSDQIAGYWLVYNNPGRDATIASEGGFIYTQGTFRTVLVPGASRTFIQGINNFGDVVGTYYRTPTDNGSFLMIDKSEGRRQ